MSDDVLRAVELYHQLGWVTVPVQFKSKMPLSKAWEQPLSAELSLRAFQTNRLNVAVHLGPHSKGLIDIDLDCTEAVSLAPSFLPPTVTFGRRSNRMSHWLYTATGNLDTKKFKDPTRKGDEAMIAEIRSNHHYTVFPPSIHSEGELIEFTAPLTPDAPPSSIPPDVLRKAVARLSACVIVCRNWPSGARHEASMALAGGLSRCGLTDEEVLAFLDAVCKSTDDDEGPDRLRAARDTLKKLHAGRKKISGFPALAEVMGEEPVEAIRSFLVDDDNGDMLHQFNDEFKFLYLGSGVAIAHLVDEPESKKKRIDYLSVATFKERTADRYITVGKGDAIKTTKIAAYWLNVPNAKPTYVATAFSPHKPVPPSVYNTWRGFAVEPNDSGDWSLLRDHIFFNVARENQEWYDWIVSFLAHAYQNPTNKEPVALVIRGSEGTGKTVFAEAVTKELVPEHSIDIYSSHQLVGKFNAHMQDCLFAVANEAFFAGDKQHESILKSLISERSLIIERKGKDAVQMPNYMRLIMTSNENWVVPAAYDSRRFGVFTIGERNKGQKPYFRALCDQLKSGGREGLLYFLLNHKYDTAFAHKIPLTGALVQQRELSRSPVETWWEQKLTNGHPCSSVGVWARRGRNGVDTWPEYVAKEALFEDFKSSLGGSVRYPRFDGAFWAEFWGYMPDKWKDEAHPMHVVNVPRRTPTGEEIFAKERLRFIKMPCLADARAVFSEIRNRDIDWPELTDEPDKKVEY